VDGEVVTHGSLKGPGAVGIVGVGRGVAGGSDNPAGPESNGTTTRSCKVEIILKLNLFVLITGNCVK